MVSFVACLAVATACSSGNAGADLVGPGAGDAGAVPPAAPDASLVAPAEAGAPLVDPVVFVHGINGSSADFAVMIDHLVADGWPRERLFAIDYADPAWGCNVDNASTLATFVNAVLTTTGATKVDLVAHSMGNLSSRKFLKDLGGAALVNTYVSLGGMHHGLENACLNPLDVCVWQELCGSKPFLTALNTAPVTPGPAIWVSIYSRDDETVPETSSHLDGAENIELAGLAHAGPDGLLERAEAYVHVKRVLEYPAP